MNENQLYYEEMVTPVGTMCIIANENAIIRIDFGTFEHVREKASNWFNRYFTNPVFQKGHDMINAAARELEDYFDKKRKQFSISYQLYGTSFQKAVWEATYQTISYGETKSYKQMGEIIDNEQAVRAIGGALSKNPCSIIVPCHRVIGSSGKLVGYGGGLDTKTYLLHFEQQ